jgi:spore coat protein U-like protein
MLINGVPLAMFASKHFARLAAAAAVIGLTLAPMFVDAAGTSSVTVSATVTNTCAFGGSTPTTVTFAGGYDPVVANASTAATATYSPQYMCTKSDAAYTWSFSSGNHSATQAIMKSGANVMNYNITDASANAYHGDGGNSFAVGAAGNGANVLTYSSFTFTIPAGQNLPAGTYTDTLTVTITP